MFRLFFLLFSVLLMPLTHAEEKVVNVSVQYFKQLAYHPQGSAPATAISLNDATLSAKIQSTINDIPVMVADVVNRGDVLVELDCRNSRAVRQSNQAKLSLAEYLLQRVTQLSKDKHASEELLRTRQSEVKIARSALTISQIDVERCQLRAPFRGVVTERMADVGEWVGVGEPLVQLVDLDQIEVSAQIPDLSIDRLQQVSEFAFVVGTQRYPLALRKTSQAVDQTARTREVRLTFTDRPASPGQSGRLIWQSVQQYLPSSYLVRRKGEYGVFIVEDNRAKFVPVPAAQEGRPILISLPDDASVIDQGRYALSHGDRVNVHNPAGS